MGEGPNRGGNSRRWIVREVEDSLRRLGTDWIDLYQVHRPDHTTDIEETLSALTDLVRQGKIRAFGCSTFPADEIVEAYHVADRRGLQRFRTEQPPYSSVTLDDAALDRIDDIVAPGTDLDPRTAPGLRRHSPRRPSGDAQPSPGPPPEAGPADCFVARWRRPARAGGGTGTKRRG
jgi:hypothetical protein